MSENPFIINRKKNKNDVGHSHGTRSLDQVGKGSTNSVKLQKVDILFPDICQLLLEIGTQLACNQQMMKRLRTDPEIAMVIPRPVATFKEMKLLGMIITRCKYYMKNNNDSTTPSAVIDKLLLKSVCRLWEAVNKEKLVLADYEEYCLRRHSQLVGCHQGSRAKLRRQPPDKNMIKNQRNKVINMITDILSLINSIDSYKVEKKNTRHHCAKLIRSHSQQKVKSNDIVNEETFQPKHKKIINKNVTSTFPKSKSFPTFIGPGILITSKNKNRSQEKNKIIIKNCDSRVGEAIANSKQDTMNQNEKQIVPLEWSSEARIIPKKNFTALRDYRSTVEFLEAKELVGGSSIVDNFCFDFLRKNIFCEIGDTFVYHLRFSNNFEPNEIVENIAEDIFTQTDSLKVSRYTSTHSLIVNEDLIRENQNKKHDTRNLSEFDETSKDQSTETDENIEFNDFCNKRLSFVDEFCQVIEQNVDDYSLTSPSEQFSSQSDGESNKNFQPFRSKYKSNDLPQWVSEETIYTPSIRSSSFVNISNGISTSSSYHSLVEMKSTKSFRDECETLHDLPRDIIKSLQLAEQRGRNLYDAIRIYTFLNSLRMAKLSEIQGDEQHRQTIDTIEISNADNLMTEECNVANSDNFDFALKEITVEVENCQNDRKSFNVDKRFYENIKTVSNRTILPFIYGAICFIVFWGLQFSITCES